MKASCILLFILSLSNGQLYFPEDTQLANYMSTNGNAIPNLNQFPRTTVSYGSFEAKDRIISKGILKLTLAVDRALQSLKLTDTDVTVYSPVGIASALALVLLGANGKTFEELSSVLGLETGLDIENSSQSVHEEIGRLLAHLQTNNNLETGVKMNLATGVFVQDGFPIRPIYKQTSENVYKSEISNVDYSGNAVAAQNTINNWVRTKTNSKINSIVGETPPTSTKVIICSALYFIGQWEKPFFDGLTRRRPFYPDGRKSHHSVMAEMMSNGGTFPYYKDTALDCEIMGFPYKGNRTTMYVVMPHQSNKEKLKDLENKLTPSELERLVGNTRYHKSVVLFPKMKIESTVDLTKALRNIGAKSLFNKNEANLALLSPGYGRQLSPSATRQNQFAPNIVVGLKPNLQDELIFTRLGNTQRNCTGNCQQSFSVPKIRNRVSRKTKRQILADTIDSVRHIINSNANSIYTENPGLYADQVLHKVYMDITETGTEAAATTSVSISRGGDIVTFRADHPFLFFIMDEDTKLVLFWGSVTTPTPSFS